MQRADSASAAYYNCTTTHLVQLPPAARAVSPLGGTAFSGNAKQPSDENILYTCNAAGAALLSPGASDPLLGMHPVWDAGFQ